jgi:starvation-inducible DNA-binding protein
MAIKTGLNGNQNKQVADELAVLLSNTYILYLKTQNFHWNVVSKQFHALHAMFEGQYEELASSADEIAERIRALGFPTPGSFKQFSKLAEIKEATDVPTDSQMIQQLLSDHELMCRNIRESIVKTQKAGDEGTADLMITRLKAHEKTAWMLRSTQMAADVKPMRVVRAK